MRPIIHKIKPSRGFSYVLYVLYNALLPILILLLVRARFEGFALLVILLSKWRMFAVRPRFWGANIRANAIDAIVGVSTLGMMASTSNNWSHLFYVIAWAWWLIFVKPRVSVVWVSAQALIGLMLGLMAIFTVWKRAPLLGLVVAVGFVCYFAAHHFFYSFDEKYTQLLSNIWAYFGAAITWILGHWLVYYGFVAQPTLIITTLAFGLSSLYYLDHFGRLTKLIKQQLLFVMTAIVLVILVFSDWGDKII
jgi:hypothetical protein